MTAKFDLNAGLQSTNKSSSDNTYWAGDKLNIPKETLIAATPGEMRLILDQATQRFKDGLLTAEQFETGLSEAAAIASPRHGGTHLKQMIDRAYENPLTSFLVSNPGAAQTLAKQSLPMLEQLGINTSGLSGGIDAAMPYLRQAKEDGLLNPDVTSQQLSAELSEPLRTALGGWAHDANTDPAMDRAFNEGSWLGNVQFDGQPVRNWETIIKLLGGR